MGGKGGGVRAAPALPPCRASMSGRPPHFNPCWRAPLAHTAHCSDRVARALRLCPRDLFVPAQHKDEALIDAPIRVEAHVSCFAGSPHACCSAAAPLAPRCRLFVALVLPCRRLQHRQCPSMPSRQPTPSFRFPRHTAPGRTSTSLPRTCMPRASRRCNCSLGTRWGVGLSLNQAFHAAAA